MLNFAAKLKGFRKNNHNQTSSAIFGEVSPGSKLSQPDSARLRIGLWPIQSQSEPLLGMGLSMLIGFLLERWPSIKVYRLPAQVEGNPLDYKWTIEKSQFGVDDWEVDDLDENAALWGTFGRNQSHYTLTLEIENDLADDEAMLQAWEVESLSELMNLLPQIAETVAEYLRAGGVDPKKPVFQSGQWDEAGLKQILEAIFDWELSLFLYLWGKNWANEQMLADFKKLSILGQTLNSDLGDWIASNAIAHALSPLYSILDTNLPLLEYAEKSSVEANTGSLYRHTVALALYNAGYSVRADLKIK